MVEQLSKGKNMLDFIQAVFARPKMYTLLGSYAEVVAFLEGYYSGLAKSKNGLSEAEKWSSFRHWLAKQLNASLSDEFMILAARYETDALTVFARFYEEFKTTGSE